MNNSFLFSLILFGSIAQGYSVSDLEDAIQNSKLRRVRVILPKLQLTQKDRFRLTHLAHDVLCFRKDAREIGKMRGVALDEEDATVTVLGMGSFILGAGIMMANKRNPNYGFSVCAGSVASMMCVSLYRYVKRTKKLAKKHHNSLRIKQLLMAYDESNEKFYKNIPQKF
jgi:hypothetical protein